MRFLGWNSFLAGWLVLSAFALPQTATSAALAVVAAFVMFSLNAFAVGRPGLRYVTAVVALVLAAAALLADVPWLAAVNDALVAGAFSALSLVSPRHHTEEPAVAHGK